MKLVENVQRHKRQGRVLGGADFVARILDGDVTLFILCLVREGHVEVDGPTARLLLIIIPILLLANPLLLLQYGIVAGAGPAFLAKGMRAMLDAIDDGDAFPEPAGLG